MSSIGSGFAMREEMRDRHGTRPNGYLDTAGRGPALRNRVVPPSGQAVAVYPWATGAEPHSAVLLMPFDEDVRDRDSGRARKRRNSP